jgi:hypothetical protein
MVGTECNDDIPHGHGFSSAKHLSSSERFLMDQELLMLIE